MTAQAARPARTMGSREVALALGLAVLNSALPTLQSYALLQTTAPEDMALYLLISGWATFGATLALLGFDTLPVKLIPQFRADGKHGRVFALVRFSVLYVATTSAVLGLAFLAFRQSGFGSGLSASAYLLGPLLLIPVTVLIALVSCLRGNGTPLVGNSLQMAAPHLLFVSLLTATQIADLGAPSANTLLFLAIGAYGLSIAFALYWLYRTLGSANAGTGDDAKAEPSTWVRGGMQLAVIGIVFSLSNNFGVMALGLFDRHADIPDFVGYSRLAALSALGLSGVNILLAPIIARLYHQGQREELQSALHQSVAVGVTVWLAIVFVIWVFRLDTKVAIGGPDGFAILALLLGAQFCYVATGTCGFLLTMTDNHVSAMRLNLFAAAINLILCAVLVPRWGGLGAAAANLASFGYANIHMAWVGYRRVGADPSVISLLADIVRRQRRAATQAG